MSHMSNPSSTPTALTRAELHSHSIFSDGEYPPEQLAKMCLERDVSCWALTDHDTCLGARHTLDLLLEDRRFDALTFIPGVEISARDERSVHVLGYGINPHDEKLRELFQTRKEEREARMLRMIELANKRGFEVTTEEVLALADDGVLARPHLARALVARGYVKSTAEAFDRYLADGMPLYVPSPYMKVEEAIALIHDYNGVALIAHPGTSRRDERIADWVEAGLDGLECHHPAHSAELAAHYEGMARRHNLLITSSSDFHGPGVAPERKFGETMLENERLDGLLERIAERGGVVRHGLIPEVA